MNLLGESRSAGGNIDAFPVGPEINDAQAMALARTTVNLFRRWQLDDEEACAILRGMAKPVWARWKDGRIDAPGRISDEQRDRMALLMCIHWAVRTIFADREYGYAWIRKPIRALKGKSVLDNMMKGNVKSLVEMRDWLYSKCHLW